MKQIVFSFILAPLLGSGVFARLSGGIHSEGWRNGNIGFLTDNAGKEQRKLNTDDCFEFQLSLNFEDGLTIWQNNTERRNWCCECKGKAHRDEDGIRRCASGTKVRIRECDHDDEKQRFLFCESDGKIRSSLDHNQCFTYSRKRHGTKIKLKPCSRSRHTKQIWNRVSDTGMQLRGFNTDSKFQLQPVGNHSLCMTQEHHPKKNETVRLQNCLMAKKNDPGKFDDTSLWVMGKWDGHRDRNQWSTNSAGLAGEYVTGNCTNSFRLPEHNLCMVADRQDDTHAVKFVDCTVERQNWYYSESGYIQNELFGANFCLKVDQDEDEQLYMGPCTPRWGHVWTYWEGNHSHIQSGDTGDCIDVRESAGNIATAKTCKHSRIDDQAFEYTRCEMSSAMSKAFNANNPISHDNDTDARVPATGLLLGTQTPLEGHNASRSGGAVNAPAAVTTEASNNTAALEAQHVTTIQSRVVGQEQHGDDEKDVMGTTRLNKERNTTTALNETKFDDEGSDGNDENDENEMTEEVVPAVGNASKEFDDETFIVVDSSMIPEN